MKTHPTSEIHPYTIRLFVDVDPAGNPIGKGAMEYRRGQENATLWFAVPDPFDNLQECVDALIGEYHMLLGTQPRLL